MIHFRDWFYKNWWLIVVAVIDAFLIYIALWTIFSHHRVP